MSTARNRRDAGTRQANVGKVARKGPAHAPTAVQHHVAGADGEDQRDADAAGRRLWFDLRPTPHHHGSLMRPDRAWWVLLWIVVVLVAIFAVPWWWF